MATWTDHIGDFNYRVSGNITFSRYRNIESYKPRFSNSWDEYRNSSEDRWGGIYWGYQVIGQFQSEEEIKNYPVNLDGQGNTTLLPGDLIYKDVNNDGVINGMDERPIGFPEGWAPILSFGGNIGLEWKGIDLNIDFSGGAMQGWRQNYELTNAYHNGGNSPAYLLEDRWHCLDFMIRKVNGFLDVIRQSVTVNLLTIIRIVIFGYIMYIICVSQSGNRIQLTDLDAEADSCTEGTYLW